MSRRSLTLAPSLYLLLCATASAQTTWYVDGSQAGPGTGTPGDPYATIQSALDAVTTVNGDLISVAPGVYVEQLRFQNKNVFVEGQTSPDDTILQAPAIDDSELVRFEGTLVQSTGLRNMTLYGGTAANVTGTVSPWGSGGALEYCVVRGFTLGCDNLYDLHLKNCTFTENVTALHHHGGGHGTEALTDIGSGLFWNNTQDFVGEDLFDGTLSLYFVLTGVDPLFVNSTANDYRIGNASPAIDAGSPNDVDPDGSRRDVGAFAHDPAWPIGASYCAPNDNSSGERGRLWVTGTANLGSANLLVSGDRMPANKLAVLFHGIDRALIPLADGVRCTSPPIERVFLFQTSNTGSMAYTYDAANPPVGVAPLNPGDVRNLQVWFRDPMGGPAGSNLTNAVGVHFRP